MNFFWKTVPYWVYFTQGEDFKITTELSQKVHYSHNQGIKVGVNEEYCLCKGKKLYFQNKILCLWSNQDLILYEGDSNF